MGEFIRANVVWIVPLLVAVISGFFYLIKKTGASNKQCGNTGAGGSITQINGNNNVVGKQ